MMNCISIKRQRFTLCIILSLILLYSLTGEIVAVNNGAGWDGKLYSDITQRFSDMIANREIDAYHMNRFLPFAILHYLFIILSIPFNTINVIIAMRLYNAVLMFLLVVIFFKISFLQKWNQNTEAIAFSFCFFNFPILKYFGYYPVSCDLSSVFLTFLGLYYYLKQSLAGQIFVIVIAFLTWPILAVTQFFLAFFPNNRVEPISKNSKIQVITDVVVRFFLYFLPPLAVILYVCYLVVRHPELPIAESLQTLRGNVSLLVVFLSIISYILFYYYATLALRVNWLRIGERILKREVIFRIIIGGVLLLLFDMFLKSLGGKAVHSVSIQLILMFKYITSDILIFLETHFIYLGLFFLIIILCWKKMVLYIRENLGIGFFLVTVLALFFIIDIETRKLASFYPLMIVPLMAVIQDMKFKLWVPIVVIVFSLATSFFWFPINTPDIVAAFDRPYYTYIEYPAQRYYMFFGPWQSHMVYYCTALVEIVIGVLVYFLYKKGLLTENHQL